MLSQHKLMRPRGHPWPAPQLSSGWGNRSGLRRPFLCVPVLPCGFGTTPQLLDDSVSSSVKWSKEHIYTPASEMLSGDAGQGGGRQ